ncbi:hypothetical protein CFK40_19615 [Virgibacillus necropolis]|uniref:DUF2268 domain-containing protein n=1 Tax=Virgibacillus necropolis TaxID=163877 RepID=A0A221MHF1_9BACI|nr:hypothetical protein CFK40_19615 [Virgibacillus necropolis]
MPVVATNQWLDHYLTKKLGFPDLDMGIQRDTLCPHLTNYYTSITTEEIHQHLLQNGLFPPSISDEKTINKMYERNIWRNVESEFNKLKVDWNGPDVPLFIFPSNLENEQLRIDFNGLAGLAHQNKLFLFVSSQPTDKEIQALLTHEYNHVCRLNYLNQEEKTITLLDAMILEGLAEMAVHERMGKEYLAKWTSMYSLEHALKYWKGEVESNLHLQKGSIRHQQFMYGNDSIPKWMGYNIGFHLVCSFVENTTCTVNQLLRMPTEQILEESAFK